MANSAHHEYQNHQQKHENKKKKKKMENNIGCIAGFFKLHRRILPGVGKRLYHKGLPPNSPGGAGAGLDFSSSSVASPAFSAELVKVPADNHQPKPSTSSSTSMSPYKSPLPLSSFEFKDGGKSPWKFARDAPRLSLDSRFVVDAKGSLHPREIRTRSANLSGDESDYQRRSPSLVARLMGIDHPLPPSDGGSGVAEPPAERKVELRRSASESRSRDPLFDSSSNLLSNCNNMDLITHILNPSTAQGEHVNPAVSVKPERARGRRRRPLPQSTYDIADCFPEPKRTPVSIHDRRLKARAIQEEPSKDLETLKRILEAIQLKGLLHSKPSEEAITRRRNLVYDNRGFLDGEPPLVLKKPATSPASRRPGNDCPPPSIRSKTVNRRSLNPAGEALPSRCPRRERPNVNRKRGGSPRRLDQTTSSRSPRSRRPTAEICRSEKSTVRAEDESSSVSESSYSTCSHPGAEWWKMEEYNIAGGSLRERCDRLLHSIIAEVTASSSNATTINPNTTNGTTTELQPSPVSVLDSTFHKEDDDSPSPVIMKRTIDFKAVQFNESDSSDLAYILEILNSASSDLSREESALFQLLEKKQLLEGKDTSKSSRVQRRLIFDSVNEILDRSQQLPSPPPPPANSVSGKPSLSYVWSEMQRIREPCPPDDFFGTISQVLRRDLARDWITGWGDFPDEVSDMVLDIERMMFKDLIGEAIRDLGVADVPRRKLVF